MQKGMKIGLPVCRRLRYLGWVFIMSLYLAPNLMGAESPDASRVVILSEDAFVPFSDINGNGLSNEIVAAAFAATGIDITLKVYPFPRLMSMVKDGKVPGGFNAVLSEDTRAEYIFGTQPIYISHQRFYYNRDDPVKIDTEDDIYDKLVARGIVVGEVLGYIYPPVYEVLKVATQNAPRLQVDAVKSDDMLITKLLHHRNRVALMTSEVAEYHIKRMNIEGQLQHGAFVWEAPLYVAFSKNHPKGKSLAKQFDQGMTLIKADGSYDQILSKYHVNISGF